MAKRHESYNSNMTGQIPGVGMSGGVNRAKSGEISELRVSGGVLKLGGLQRRFRWGRG